MEMHFDEPRLTYLSPAQLIHEVATVVFKTLQKYKFPETILRIEKYKLLERTSALQGLDRVKIAGIIWETYEREVEKLKLDERREKGEMAKGRKERKELKAGRTLGSL